MLDHAGPDRDVQKPGWSEGLIDKSNLRGMAGSLQLLLDARSGAHALCCDGDASTYARAAGSRTYGHIGYRRSEGLPAGS